MNIINTKKNYISPRIQSEEVELEQGIAAGSAVDTTVEQSWEKSDDDNRLINW
ncbi:MAG: hypothetical protein LBJ04_06500 [Sphingobacterium sp.]|jgi:hypothetical protein|uniref:hypothetical protein n=1 Tax=Sphingobacterium sp. TaxID=341027 RepID=UPI0028349158|nr:hypothetical protein [Sphingobacterium sp.]MDR0262859.1 hypothetical protein [Sphingobacterium sp.]